MKHFLKCRILFCAYIFFFLQSCTGTGGGGSSLVDAIKDIVSPTPDAPTEPALPGAPAMSPNASVQEAEAKITEIQTTLNQDTTYAITNQDVSDLKAEGIITDDSEIKAWVK